ncbi:MAG TPA: GNAT family N-acetyltransferase [Mycobacteriales bacterium]|jgi:GNAT superfamily N-acetyltransferase|nr:family N-acetyltransferase [Mycobacterium sp.]
MVLIRPGTRVDVEPALEVWREAYLADRGVPEVEPEHAERVRDFLRDRDSFLIVAEDDGPLVGMAVGMQGRAGDGTGPPVPGLMHLKMLFVLPDHWGQGLGGVLVDVVLDESRIREYDHAEVWAHVDNPRAWRLYDRKGFLPTGRERRDLAGHVITQFARSL